MSKKHFTLILSTLLTLSACGGGGGGGSSAPVPNASPGGIWTGTDASSGLSVEGLVDESGDAHFIRSDGAQFIGTVTTSGTSVQSSFQGFTNFGATFADGSTHGTGTLTGTIQERSSITSTEAFTTDIGNRTSGALNLTFNALYNRASSLATVSGNFGEVSSGTVLSITGSGALTYQDPATGCVLNGTVSIINASYNAYKVDFTLGNCVGNSSALNGVAFDGLATLDNTVSPEQLVVGVNGSAAGSSYAIVDYFNRI